MVHWVSTGLFGGVSGAFSYTNVNSSRSSERCVVLRRGVQTVAESSSSAAAASLRLVDSSMWVTKLLRT
jgi:hypothetical protein